MSKNFVLIPCLLLLINVCQASTKTSYEITNWSPGVIKAMTFNIRVDTLLDGFNRWNSRKHAACSILAENSADVFGLQEALDSQVNDIQKSFPQYGHYMAGRNDGKRKGESCAVFYRKDRFALDDSGTFWFSDTPEKPSKDWGALWPRICSWVHLIDKNTGSGFYVYNVHLDVLSQNSREKSTALLAERIRGRKTADPFIVMGDFNMELDNPAMTSLQNIGMGYAWHSVHRGRPAPSTHHNSGRASGGMIDHIPICKGAVCLEAKVDSRQVDGRFASDHFPVIATIQLPQYKAVAVQTNSQNPRSTENQ